MYVFPLMHDIFAVVPYRLWWAPWRWKLKVCWWAEVDHFRSVPPKYIATNISKAEVIGLMKILGYEHEIRP